MTIAKPATATDNARKVFIKTYGCQMNVYDSQRMSEVLEPMGYSETDMVDDADLVILNTCHIREKAAEKVYSEIGRLRKVRQKRQAAGNAMTIAVAGCVAQAEGEEIIARAPAVDLVFGPQTYHHLPKYLDEVERNGKKLVETEFPAADKFGRLDQAQNRRLANGVTAFVTVQEGCDKFCTFCVVPYTRGVEFSRPVQRISDEVKQLVENGVHEFTLLGQNVNAYHGEGQDGDSWSLAKLIQHLSEIDGVERIRFTTSHPRDMDDELIAAHGENKKLMPYLHLPIQSGSDRILKAMNRRHTADEYVALIERIRQARPDIALSGDFIVGFPGESDEDFDATMELVKKVAYAQAFSFKYSPRPGTPAAEHEQQVEEAVKSERLAQLQMLLREQQTAFNEACLGRQFDVLLERDGRHQGQMVGRSPYLQSVHLDGRGHKIGDMVRVEIDKVAPNSLSAHIIDT